MAIAWRTASKATGVDSRLSLVGATGWAALMVDAGVAAGAPAAWGAVPALLA
ncbi:hypothetical protein JCM9957A_51310 [Kineosporia succinea]